MPVGSWIGGTFMSSEYSWVAELGGNGNPDRRKLVKLAALFLSFFTYHTMDIKRCHMSDLLGFEDNLNHHLLTFNITFNYNISLYLLLFLFSLLLFSLYLL